MTNLLCASMEKAEGAENLSNPQAVEFAGKSAIMAVDIRCRRGEFQFMAAYKSIQEGPRRTASAPTHR
jgi:hypothetical protein